MVSHILRVPTQEIRRETDGKSRWCFVCRKHRDFDLVTRTPILSGDFGDACYYYGPHWQIECTHCKAVDGDLFPGRWRQWDDDDRIIRS